MNPNTPAGNGERVGFLTPEWVAALEEAGRASDSLRKATRSLELTVEQIVSDGGPDGSELRYTLTFSHGDFRARWGGAGPDGAAPAGVAFRQNRSTAAGLSQGTLNAQLAFMLGLLRVSGDLQRLMSARDAFLELADVFAGVRARTDY